ncbi:hypothetical protein K438DRAFT_1765842 [Mycena galopus ATCC 62051]|nr:hypothetical protein K438DRAFT_1765842 [Mycena galopus ATCC 62051]
MLVGLGMEMEALHRLQLVIQGQGRGEVGKRVPQDLPHSPGCVSSVPSLMSGLLGEFHTETLISFFVYTLEKRKALRMDSTLNSVDRQTTIPTGLHQPFYPFIDGYGSRLTIQYPSVCEAGRAVLRKPSRRVFETRRRPVANGNGSEPYGRRKSSGKVTLVTYSRIGHETVRITPTCIRNVPEQSREVLS